MFEVIGSGNEHCLPAVGGGLPMMRVGHTVLLVLLYTTGALAQGRDRTPPTAPANLRATAVNSYTVTLAWDPSTDNSGTFSYRLQATGWPSGATFAISGSTTTFVFSSQQAGAKYQFYVYAVDGSGNKSKGSNTITVTLKPDTTAPSQPLVSVGAVSATTVALSWSPSVDDGPYVSYQVLVNDSPSVWAGGSTSILIQGLTPSTSYRFAVKARDNWQNWSPISNEVHVTTAAPDATDTTPPTAPSHLSAWDFGGPEPEIWLFWTQSTDNVDSPSVIRYEIFVNGRLDHSVVGRGSTVLYGDPNGVPNTLTVIAVDVAGNRSTSASISCSQGTCK